MGFCKVKEWQLELTKCGRKWLCAQPGSGVVVGAGVVVGGGGVVGPGVVVGPVVACSMRVKSIASHTGSMFAV